MATELVERHARRNEGGKTETVCVYMQWKLAAVARGGLMKSLRPKNTPWNCASPHTFP